MATLYGKQITTLAATILQDQSSGGIQWPQTELFKYLHAGQRLIVMLKPDANPVNKSMQLAVGTKQQIPSTGMYLIDVTRNMGADGKTPGIAITPKPRQHLDEQRRTWHTLPAADEIEHFCFDERDPTRFYNFPPSSGQYVEIVFAEAPLECARLSRGNWSAGEDYDYADSVESTAGGQWFVCILEGKSGASEPSWNTENLGDITYDNECVWKYIGSEIVYTISLGDQYQDPLTDYILFRAWLKNAEYTENLNRATMHLQNCLMALGKSDQIESINDPNVSLLRRLLGQQAQGGSSEK